MTRKAMSIIGRIIGLLLVVALAFGITWCATHWSKVQAESQKVWDKLFGKNDKQEQVQPTPNEEQFSLDGLYYMNVNGDYSFVQIRDYSLETQTGSYGIVGGCMKDSQICLFKGWESRVELNPFNTTEDEQYIHVSCKDIENGVVYKIAIYDKATKKLYYDFSDGQQLPGGSYEEQLLFEMVPFIEFVEIECQHETIMDMTKTQPTCTEPGLKENWCYDCNKFLGTETLPALGHDYVGGKCTRCGESDPNYVEEVSSIDGLYYRANTDGTIVVYQIEGDRFVIFTGYTQNGDESKIYFPQDWTTYLGGFGNSLTIEENDTQIICSVPVFMEIYKDNEELYEVYKNYFVYDKETKELRFGMNKVILTRIDAYNILPYEEPRISIENDILHMTDMTGVDGTYTVYYQNSSTMEEGAYVAGNVTEFDLTVLFNHDPKFVSGNEYIIRVVFATNDGFLIRGYESIRYTVPNAEHTHSYEWQTKIDATCISAGAEQGFCSCGASADREIPALGHDYVDGVCSRCGETALTWQLNDRLTLFGEETKVFDINFISNNQSFKAICFTLSADPIMYYLTDAADMGSGITLYSENFKWMGHDETDHSAYRTITFETAPTGDLLAWLQANATPQV